MTKKTKQQILRYTVYFILLVVLYSLQTAPRLFEIAEVKPVLIIPYVLAISIFENEIVSGIFCGLGGMFWDLSSDCVFGFNTIIFFVLGVTISLIVMHLMRSKMINYMMFLTIAMIIQGGLYYAFYYLLWEIESSQIVLIRYIIPTVIYTVAVGVPIFYLTRFLASKLSDGVRM